MVIITSSIYVHLAIMGDYFCNKRLFSSFHEEKSFVQCFINNLDEFSANTWFDKI